VRFSDGDHEDLTYSMLETVLTPQSIGQIVDEYAAERPLSIKDEIGLYEEEIAPTSSTGDGDGRTSGQLPATGSSTLKWSAAHGTPEQAPSVAANAEVNLALTHALELDAPVAGNYDVIQAAAGLGGIKWDPVLDSAHKQKGVNTARGEPGDEAQSNENNCGANVQEDWAGLNRSGQVDRSEKQAVPRGQNEGRRDDALLAGTEIGDTENEAEVPQKAHGGEYGCASDGLQQRVMSISDMLNVDADTRPEPNAHAQEPQRSALSPFMFKDSSVASVIHSSHPGKPGFPDRADVECSSCPTVPCTLPGSCTASSTDVSQSEPTQGDRYEHSVPNTTTIANPMFMLSKPQEWKGRRFVVLESLDEGEEVGVGSTQKEVLVNGVWQMAQVKRVNQTSLYVTYLNLPNFPGFCDEIFLAEARLRDPEAEVVD